MPTLITRYNWGSAIRNWNPELARQLDESYTDTALVVNSKISKRVISGQDPPASDSVNKNFEIGDIWVRTDTDTAWIMTSRTTDIAVTWTQIT